MTVDKRGGRWVEIRQQGERLVRAEYGAQLDAERLRKRDAILELLLSEAAEGRMYSAYQFAETFENKLASWPLDHPPSASACSPRRGT